MYSSQLCLWLIAYLEYKTYFAFVYTESFHINSLLDFLFSTLSCLFYHFLTSYWNLLYTYNLFLQLQKYSYLKYLWVYLKIIIIDTLTSFSNQYSKRRAIPEVISIIMWNNCNLKQNLVNSGQDFKIKLYF